MIKTLTKLNSSMIYAIGYDPKEKILEVVFTKGKIWAYQDVPEEVYKDLLESKSVGSYMRSSIIDCYPDYEIS